MVIVNFVVGVEEFVNYLEFGVLEGDSILIGSLRSQGLGSSLRLL